MTAWPTPAVDEVHLWQARLDVGTEELARLATLLTEPELDRSRGFRFERDRARFIAGRGQLRVMLGGYLDVQASEIALVDGPNGKPRLAGGTAQLRFNLAHSDDFVVFAVAWNREVGVDVERIRSDFPVDQVARHHFSPRERLDLEGLPEGERLRATFDCWTRKEAYLKASGVGLTVPLDGFDVTVRPGEPVRLSRPAAEWAENRSWSLHAFDAGPGYAAAVAVEGPPCKVPSAARRLELL